MKMRRYHHSTQNCVLGFHMFKKHGVFEVAEAPAGAPGLAFGLKMLVYVIISVYILYVHT